MNELFQLLPLDCDAAKHLTELRDKIVAERRSLRELQAAHRQAQTDAADAERLAVTAEAELRIGAISEKDHKKRVEQLDAIRGRAAEPWPHRTQVHEEAIGLLERQFS